LHHFPISIFLELQELRQHPEKPLRPQLEKLHLLHLEQFLKLQRLLHQLAPFQHQQDLDAPSLQLRLLPLLRLQHLLRSSH
jgi:hypothetical protein